MRAVLVFADGVGLGSPDPAVNPFAADSIGVLRLVRSGMTPVRGGVCAAADACLGVEGLPQSATGQTALFTGVNAAALLGRHLPGYPNEALRAVLREHSLLKRVTERGGVARFVNAYRPLFFGLKESTKWRLSATTVATLAAGVPFFGIEDLRAGRCLYHDFTNAALIEKGIPAPLYSPEEAGRLLAGLSADADFLLYEYFLTDRAGHGQDFAAASDQALRLDRFMASLLEHAALDSTLVVFTSDHGNLEDMGLKTHTRNDVPVLAWGPGRERFAERVHSILDVTPALLSLLPGAERGGEP